MKQYKRSICLLVASPAIFVAEASALTQAKDNNHNLRNLAQ